MQEQILQFLRMSGPTLPGKVAKHLNLPLLLASAGLADLSAQGKVKVSKLKVGGSPLYYLPGQEEHLEQFAAGNTDPKDFRVLQQLREQKVLRESTLDLLSKVALRHLPDFALPLQVSFQEHNELFWKWHLLSEEETREKIQKLLMPKEEAPEEALPPENFPSPSSGAVPRKGAPDLPFQKRLVEEEKGIQKEENILGKEERRKTEGLVEKTETEKWEETRKKKTVVEEEFLPDIEQFFKHLKIMVEQKETLRKNAELNFLVQVPSVVGSLKYFCKAKQKKRCDEKDLSAAYMEAQIKKLPLLFLYTEELSKKAEEMLKSGAFENVIVKKLK